MSRDICLLSGGQSSWRAAKVRRLLAPSNETVLLFTDVLYEDADTYRFLIQSAANVFGRAAVWAPAAEDFPDYRVSTDVPIEEYRGNPEWRAFLAQLRARAAEEIPELIWLVEGRDPWEIFRDRRYLGNTRVDPCSDTAKRKVLAAWCTKHGLPDDVLVYGIGPHEDHRFDDGNGHGIRPRLATLGRIAAAPLIEIEREHDILALPNSALRIAYGQVQDFGLRPARNYALGYIHDNCGGFCIKAGHAHYQNRHRVHPERFDYDIMMEAKLIAFLKKKHSILTDRRGKRKVPMTLAEFKARLVANPQVEFEYERGSSGCGCMLEAA